MIVVANNSNFIHNSFFTGKMGQMGQMGEDYWVHNTDSQSLSNSNFIHNSSFTGWLAAGFTKAEEEASQDHFEHIKISAGRGFC